MLLEGTAAAAPSELGVNALRVLEARCLRRDADGRVVETPDELWWRVARGVAEAERFFGDGAAHVAWSDRFHELLRSLAFLPNSPALANAGTPLGQLAACFVLPIHDSTASIFDALRGMALIQKTGGGTGFDFSNLRPRGEAVTSTGGSASGPVAFMRVFDAATASIKQGGRRRGANMGVLDVRHPDILEFVDAKLDGTSLANFNISVSVDDGFMEAALADQDYDLLHPRSRRPVGRLRARHVLDRIAHAAWACGDPGLLFRDAIERANPLPELGRIAATNPCGEVPLLPYESCFLGSINLARMLARDGADVDWPRLAEIVRLGVRFLDDALEVSRAPLPEIERAAKGSRKIGLGVMGFAELLLHLGVSYASPDAISWADRLMAFIAREALEASRELAAARGTFPYWQSSVYAARGERVRNATRLSIAPTGTIAIIAGTSGGIEPLFALAYRRRHTLGGEPLVEVNPMFARHAERHLGARAQAVLERVVAEGHLGRVTDVPESVRALFVTATEVAPCQHLLVQQAFQRHVDNAVSKTVNLPETATPKEVADAYVCAWRLGVKGVTVYRSGSKEDQVLELGVGEEPIAREYFTRCDPEGCGP